MTTDRAREKSQRRSYASVAPSKVWRSIRDEARQRVRVRPEAGHQFRKGAAIEKAYFGRSVGRRSSAPKEKARALRLLRRVAPLRSLSFATRALSSANWESDGCIVCQVARCFLDRRTSRLVRTDSSVREDSSTGDFVSGIHVKAPNKGVGMQGQRSVLRGGRRRMREQGAKCAQAASRQMRSDDSIHRAVLPERDSTHIDCVVFICAPPEKACPGAAKRRKEGDGVICRRQSCLSAGGHCLSRRLAKFHSESRGWDMAPLHPNPPQTWIPSPDISRKLTLPT